MSELDRLLQEAEPDDPRVSEALLREHYAFVYRLALSIVGDPAEADDAAQETFIRALRNLRRYQAGTQLRSWLAAIAVNACRDLLRRRRARHGLMRLLAGIGLSSGARPSPEEQAIQSDSREALRQAVATLGEKHRLPVILRYVHGLPVREIARILNVSEGTVHSRLHYAHRKLRDRLAQQPTEPEPRKKDAPWTP